MDGSDDRAMDPKNRADWQDRHDRRFLEGKYATPESRAVHLPPGRVERPWQPVEQPAWVQDIRNQQAAVLRAELFLHLERMTAGHRIRLLRRVRGWTQERAAKELGVNRRTVIRHERGEHQPQLSLWERLRQLESDNAELLVISFGRR
jgi:DNA-binding XRE family transcriptional regulator